MPEVKLCKDCAHYDGSGGCKKFQQDTISPVTGKIITKGSLIDCVKSRMLPDAFFPLCEWICGESARYFKPYPEFIGGEA